MQEHIRRNGKKPCKQIFSYYKMLEDFIKMFFDMSSIHGLPHISQNGRHFIERVIWIIFVAAAIYGAAILSNITLIRYIENPTVISMERDRFNWNTTFPPATVCTDKKYDVDKLEDYIEKNNSIKDKELFRKFVKSLLEATYLNLDSIVEYEGISGEEFINFIFNFRFPFKPTIVNSAGMEKLSVDPTFTEMGLCYSFNSQIAVYSSPDIWNNSSWRMLPKKDTLSVNPLDGEVFINLINITSGYQVYFHSSFESVDIASKNIRTSDNNFLQLHISGLTILAADGIRSLTPKQRKCRFYYESNLQHFAVYSYILCRMECRASLAKRLCGCLPHFYKKLAGEIVCDVKGLHCLAKYRERLIFLKGECSCVANCEETVYVVDFTDEREWFLGSNLQWGMIEYPEMRLRRNVIFGLTDLLVYIGGMAGLFLGCSFLSFMEIVYFFTLRLLWFVIRYGDDTKRKRNVKMNSYNQKLIYNP